ncbi:MAG: OmpH family outer membrane protein [Desulfobacterales bacterium]|nr:OmpH family outer membrane protein [Desulfobacterales bacterium]MCF8079742.1 OmpH family outer membrane protein [Desulfobacterales bacterium]
MHRLTAIGVCFLYLAVSAAGVLAAEPVKIGILDFQMVLQQSKAGMAAQERINEAGKKMEAELQDRKDDIEEKRKNFERETLVMGKEAREEKEREIRILINDFKTLQQKYAAEFKAREQTLIRKIQEEAFVLAEKIGKEQGFSLILEKRESAAIYHDPRYNITEELIRRYDQTTAGAERKAE